MLLFRLPWMNCELYIGASVWKIEYKPAPDFWGFAAQVHYRHPEVGSGSKLVGIPPKSRMKPAIIHTLPRLILEINHTHHPTLFDSRMVKTGFNPPPTLS
jgi:hypothetical protein